MHHQTKVVYTFSKNSSLTFLKAIFKNHIFIFFSFINMFLPFFCTMIASLNEPNGTLNLISIGLISSFSTIFNQLLFLLVTAINYISMNNNLIFKDKYHLNISTKYFIILIFSLICIALFILLSGLYTKFSVYKNIEASLNYAIKYASVLSLSFIFNGYIYYIVIRQWEIDKKYSYLFLALYLSLNIILIPILATIPPYKEANAWIGLSVAQLLTSIVCFLTIIGWLLINQKVKLTRIDFKSIRAFFKYGSNFIVSFLLTTILKTILIIVICLTLGISKKDTPIGVMVAKIIWYNSLYFCGFFADGLIYALEYTRMSNHNNPYWRYLTKNNAFVFCGIIIGVTFLINVCFNAATPALADLYAKHQTVEIVSPLGPLAPAWSILYPGFVNSHEIFSYLWSPSGVYNFQLYNPATNTFQLSFSYALIYMTTYHMFISGSKALGIKEIKVNQKFNWKDLIKSIVMISSIMAIIVIIAVAPKDNKNFIKAFPGIDSFAFATMIVSFVLFLFPVIGYLAPRKPKATKKVGVNNETKQEIKVI